MHVRNAYKQVKTTGFILGENGKKIPKSSLTDCIGGMILLLQISVLALFLYHTS